jgi:hypothetical protein
VLVSYLYALTVRMAVVAVEQPGFRNDSAYRSEFQQHLAWLNGLQGLNAPRITHWNAGGVSTNSYFQVCSTATDQNSGVVSVLHGSYPSAGNPDCTNWLYGTQAEATDELQYYEFYDNWSIEEEMGIHAIQKLASLVAVDASAPIFRVCLPGHPCVSTYASLAPLVSSSGQCLTLDTSYGKSLTLASCNQGSADQTWQTADMNATASVGLADASACVEVSGWDPSLMLYPEACASSPGEAYTITSKNELRWGRDSSQCLTANGSSLGLKPCNGSVAQTWGRSWPIKIIGVHPGLPVAIKAL